MRNIYKFFVVISASTLIFSLFFVHNASALYTQAVCGDTICTTIDSFSLEAGQTGIDPATRVTLTFSAVKKNADGTPSQTQIECGQPNHLYHAVKHYIAGDLTNYEYLSPGDDANFDYTFNSGVDQQKNKYVGVFYCWRESQGTSKTGIDFVLSQPGGGAQTPIFDLTTRATTINPECSQITTCSNYPVVNDCTGNRCKLSPACKWTGSACIAIASTSPTTSPSGGSTQKFELPNPIGVTNFQDLVNIIGVWIFNLAIPIAVIVIIYAGVLMLTAGGVPARFQKGAKALWYAVLGLAVVLIGKGFVTLVQSILSLKK